MGYRISEIFAGTRFGCGEEGKGGLKKGLEKPMLASVWGGGGRGGRRHKIQSLRIKPSREREKGEEWKMGGGGER
eukprot:1367717-Amorphochlora_amoeboformis.AAC.1